MVDEKNLNLALSVVDSQIVIDILGSGWQAEE